ncbi:MAG: MlaD family protein [Bacteroidales bacterium]|nr:MlaD family protein [Bacteroidales bacterium]
MRKFTKEIKIAIVSIMSLLLLYYGINYLKGVNLLKPANYYYLILHDVSGLTISSPVYVDGYKAGLVRSFDYDYDHPGNILVEISMDKEMKIAKGSHAQYEGDVLGTAVINLILNIQSNQFYQPGDTLPSMHSISLMDKVEKEMMPQFSQVMLRIDTVLVGLQKIVANPALNQSINNIEGTTAQLNETSAMLNKLVQNDVPKIVENMKTISSDFSTVSGNLKKVDFAQTISSVDTTLMNLKTLTGRLNKSDNTLGLLMQDRVLYDSLSATVGNANQLMIDLKSHPKRYVHFSVFGRK